jgi:putative aldouronate transport system permease protein
MAIASTGGAATRKRRSWSRFLSYLLRTWPLYAMLIPGIVLLAIFHYYPMYGVVIAFQKFNPGLGFVKSPWVGWANFRTVLSNPDFYNVLRNSLVIAISKIVSTQICAVALAVLLNEIRSMAFKRSLQTVVYLPHFLSWIVLGGILIDILSTSGLVAKLYRAFHAEPPMFLGSNATFVPMLIVTNLWKEIGWSTIIYLAALMSIDPQLHEAAAIDGASRWKRILHVTLPGIQTTVVLLACLALGNVLQAGFDQVFTLYNPTVYRTADILDTYVYRAGLISAQYSLAGAIGLFKSVMGFVLIVIAYWLADKFAGYRIF